MHFIKKSTDIDLGDTPVENIFINDFMPMANGTYVKVYLLGYKYASDQAPALSADNQTIARQLNIPLSDVLEAWDFWEKKGIIKKHTSADPDQYGVEFISLKQLYIDNNYKAIHMASEEASAFTGTYSCSPADLIEANKVPEIKEMFYQINQLVRRSLVPQEMMEILEWIYNYNMDSDLIIRAFTYCVHQKKIKNIKYVGAVIRNWYDHGIITMQKVDEYFEKNDERYIKYEKIFKALGFHSRGPSESEKKVMDTWLGEWQFSMDIILKACENSKKTTNPSINYINGILSNWKKDGVQSLEDLQNREVPKAPSTKIVKPKTNRFHNFKQPNFEYTDEELEKLLRNKD